MKLNTVQKLKWNEKPQKGTAQNDIVQKLKWNER
jgi:hypothetical protein